MRRFVFFRFFIMSLVSILILSISFSFILQSARENSAKDAVLNYIVAVDNSYNFTMPARDVKTLSKANDYKITMYNAKGYMLADDTSTTNIGNLSDRPEVLDALDNDLGISIRRSTRDSYVVSVAKKVRTGNILRVTATISDINYNFVVQLPFLLLTILVSLLVANFMANRFAQKIIQPVDDIIENIHRIQNQDYYGHLEYNPFVEYNPLIDSINELSWTIKESINTLEFQKDQLNYFLECIEEGFVMIDENMEIIHINKNAATFLQSENDYTQIVSLSDLSSNQRIHELTEKSILTGTSSVFDLHFDDSGYVCLVTIAPIDNRQYIRHGAMILVTDVTDIRNAQQIRRDFFANASHELKTPITSIQGFSELIASGIITDEEKLMEFNSRIQKEALKMEVIIRDILELASLEESEGNWQDHLQKINLYTIAEECIEHLDYIAAEKGVTISLRGGTGNILATKKDAIRLVRNLMENAIKYNRPGGKVFVNVDNTDRKVILSISDTGVGIPRKDIYRIFERFYRVDKARSRAVGGTGLGLSIVKQIAAKYRAEIEVASEKDEGSTFVVTFDKYNKRALDNKIKEIRDDTGASTDI